MKYLALAGLLLIALCIPARMAQAQTSEQTLAEERQILVLLRAPPARYRADSTYGGTYADGALRAARERLGRRIARKHRVEYVDVWPMPELNLDCVILAAQDAESAQRLAEDIARDEDVEWAQPVRRYQTRASTANSAAPAKIAATDTAPRYNDPLFPVAPVAKHWRLASLHRFATGKGVTIAVIDTRIDARHPDLDGQVAVEQDFVVGHAAGPEDHGTAVAGVIAAKADNRLGMVGVAPQARLLALRACWQLADSSGIGGGTSVCDSLSLAKALHFAIERDAQVINMSLSGPTDRLLAVLIDKALARGTTIVASVDPTVSGGGFPASHTDVIAVAVEEASHLVPAGAILAPGSGIPTTRPGAKWQLVSGTSFAAAHVAGLVALMRERHKATIRGRESLVTMPQMDAAVVDAHASLMRPPKAAAARGTQP
jgi:subtilisin family serine protease